MKSENKMFFNTQTDSFVFNHLKTVCENPDGFTVHTHNVPELIYVRAISGSYLTEDKEYKLTDGDIIITLPGIHHRMEIKKGSLYERYDICFDPSLIRIEDFSEIYGKNPVINSSFNSIISDIFNKTDYYYRELNEKDFGNAVKLLLNEVLLNLKIYSKNDFVRPYFPDPIISKAISYINENLFDITSVSQISNHLYISESYLFKLFKSRLKISPKQFMISKKMYIANKEISAGKKPTDVFRKMNFSDYSVFYKTYKKQFGYSPSDDGGYVISNENIKG